VSGRACNSQSRHGRAARSLTAGRLELGSNGGYATNYYYDDVAINSQGYPTGGGGAQGTPSLASPPPNPDASSRTAVMISGLAAAPMVVASPPESQSVPLASRSLPLPAPSKTLGGALQPSEVGPKTVSTAVVDSFFADWTRGLVQENLSVDLPVQPIR